MSKAFDYVAPLANKDGFTVERRGDAAILGNGSGYAMVWLSGLEFIQNDHKDNFEMLVQSRYDNAKRVLLANG